MHNEQEHNPSSVLPTEDHIPQDFQSSPPRNTGTYNIHTHRNRTQTNQHKKHRGGLGWGSAAERSILSTT